MVKVERDGRKVSVGTDKAENREANESSSSERVKLGIKRKGVEFGANGSESHTKSDNEAMIDGG